MVAPTCSRLGACFVRCSRAHPRLRVRRRPRSSPHASRKRHRRSIGRCPACQTSWRSWWSARCGARSERRSRQRVLFRRDHRGDPQRARADPRLASRRPDVVVRVQGKAGRSPQHRRAARGRVRAGGQRSPCGRVRITAQLVNVADGFHLWSERYDRELADVFAVQDDIAHAITETLKGKLMAGSRAAPPPPSRGRSERELHRWSTMTSQAGIRPLRPIRSPPRSSGRPKSLYCAA